MSPTFAWNSEGMRWLTAHTWSPRLLKRLGKETRPNAPSMQRCGRMGRNPQCLVGTISSLVVFMKSGGAVNELTHCGSLSQLDTEASAVGERGGVGEQ